MESVVLSRRYLLNGGRDSTQWWVQKTQCFRQFKLKSSHRHICRNGLTKLWKLWIIWLDYYYVDKKSVLNRFKFQLKLLQGRLIFKQYVSKMVFEKAYIKDLNVLKTSLCRHDSLVPFKSHTRVVYPSFLGL